VTTEPLVTVVVPTKDRPQLVARAVSSALAQTYDNLEVVVVDDGSTDPLILPTELASDRRVRVLPLRASQGPARARNIGVQSSHGPLIAFLDDDDCWRPGKVERQVGILTSCADSVAAAETGFDLWRGDRLVERYLPDVERDLALALLEKPCLQPSTVLLRRSAFDALGGFDPALWRVEDWELWVRFADRYEAVAIPEVHVDRSESDPADELTWYREMVRRLGPRIDALPARERNRIRAVHLLVESHLLFESGERSAARAATLRAVHIHPSSWGRGLLYLGRSMIGERAWAAGKRRVLRTPP
jgi:glycosyltransferase involved in cell wall biosynthesis